MKTYRIDIATPALFWTKAVMKKTLESTIKTKTTWARINVWCYLESLFNYYPLKKSRFNQLLLFPHLFVLTKAPFRAWNVGNVQHVHGWRRLGAPSPCRFNGAGCDQQSYVGIHMQVSFGLVESYDWLQKYSSTSSLNTTVFFFFFFFFCFRTPDFFRPRGVPCIFSDSWTIEKCKHNQIKTTKQPPKNQLMEL